MPIIATQDSGGGDFKSLDPGTYISRCVSVWDIGTHYNKWHDNWKDQIVLRWEVPEETNDDGTPVTISKFYTLSLHEKSNLYGDLVAWRGKNFTAQELSKFDVTTVLGVPCLLTVTHTDDGKQKVSGVSKLGKGMKCPDAVHELHVYDRSTDEDGESYNKLPEWVQKQVDQCRQCMPADQIERMGSASAATPAPASTDDDGDCIPFAQIDHRLI